MMQVFLVSPRGFCAGVKRAVNIVEGALAKYGRGIYVKHEIVHNKYVVDHFIKKGVIFVSSLEDIPNDSVVIFSAHGVSKEVEEKARLKNLKVVDATCPLVKKVHRVVAKHHDSGREIILIGHKGHPEVEGTMGQISGVVHLVETVEDVDGIQIRDEANLAYITQTTLSIDETIDIIAALKKRFPEIISQDGSDICYATQNRQDAVKKIVQDVEILLVIGSKNSSNSNRLRDIGLANNIPSYLIDSVKDLDDEWLNGRYKVGVTSGASAPEVLVRDLVKYLVDKYNAGIIECEGILEDVEFHVPKEVRILESDLV